MSLYDIALHADAYLKRWQFPCHVDYNNDRITADTREGYDDRVEFSHDRQSGDAFVPITGAHRGRRGAQLNQGAIALVYARSPVEGARTSEHEIACLLYRDALICALAEWANTAKSHQLAFVAGRFLSKSERSDVEAWAGAVYELRFVTPHPVEQRTYPGGWRETYTLQPGDFAPTIVTTSLGD